MSPSLGEFQLNERINIFMRVTSRAKKGVIQCIDNQCGYVNGWKKLPGATLSVIIHGVAKAMEWTGKVIVKLQQGSYMIKHVERQMFSQGRLRLDFLNKALEKPLRVNPVEWF